MDGQRTGTDVPELRLQLGRLHRDSRYPLQTDSLAGSQLLPVLGNGNGGIRVLHLSL